MAARFAARLAVVDRRRLALVRESFGQHARQLADRLILIRVVVAFVSPVSSTCRVLCASSFHCASKCVSSRFAVLCSFSSTRCTCRPCSHLRADMVRQFAQPFVVVDRVHGVEAQAVEAIFVDPVERVVEEEIAHLRTLEIDRRTPGRVRAFAEERLGVCAADSCRPGRSGCRPRRGTPSGRDRARRRSAPSVRPVVP